MQQQQRRLVVASPVHSTRAAAIIGPPSAVFTSTASRQAGSDGAGTAKPRGCAVPFADFHKAAGRHSCAEACGRCFHRRRQALRSIADRSGRARRRPLPRPPAIATLPLLTLSAGPRTAPSRRMRSSSSARSVPTTSAAPLTTISGVKTSVWRRERAHSSIAAP